jgi:hypothetical protein
MGLFKREHKHHWLQIGYAVEYGKVVDTQYMCSGCPASIVVPKQKETKQ